MLSKQTLQKRFKNYVLISVGLAIFSAVYESFAHQVYSIFIIALFAIPLLLGALPTFIAMRLASLRIDHAWQHLIHNFAIATLVVGSALQGVFEIYGSANGFVLYYWIVGGGLLLASLMMWLIKFKNKSILA